MLPENLHDTSSVFVGVLQSLIQKLIL